MNPYSSLKIFHHQDKLDILRKNLQIVPSQVQLIISDLCNQCCQFCAYRMPGYTSNELFKVIDDKGRVNNNPNRMITYPKVKEILDDCKAMGVKAIQITGGGEPTVHPDHTKIFWDVIERGMKLAVVTNGVKLSEQDFEILGVASWVRVSIDAGTPETYCKIREVSSAHYHKAWANVKELARRRDMYKDAYRQLVLGIGFVVTKDNWWEVYDCCEQAREAGADNIRISAIFQNEDEKYFTEFHGKVVDALRSAKKLNTDTFQIIDNFGSRVDDLKLHNPDYEFCGYQQFNSYIGADLNVYRCCNTAYSQQGLLGSIKEQSYKQFWESEEKHDKIKNFDARSCERCMFSNINRTILYALDPNPVHVDFV